MNRMLKTVARAVAVCLVVGAGQADEPARDNQKETAAVIAKWLSIGAEGGALPSDFAVTIETGGYPIKESGKTNRLFDAWCFTPDSVSELNAKHEVVATSPFQGIKKVCWALAHSDLMALANAPRGTKTTGKITLLGIPCLGGMESITVTADGRSIRVIGESCMLPGFANKKHQERFTSIYRALRNAARAVIAPEKIHWGTPVNGLQLGIAPPVTENGDPEPIFDGNALRVRVFCRNAGDVPVRLLASVHLCLLGEGGRNALLASELVLTPKDGGQSISITYQGWNHLSLLDKRRPKGQQPQETLNASFGGTADIQLSEEDAKRMTTVLAPGETGPATNIHFEPWKKPRSWWWFKRDTDTVTAGTYRVTATFKVDQELSEWNGEVTSQALEVEIGQPLEK